MRDVEAILDGKPIEEVEIDQNNDLITTRREEFRNEIASLLPRLAEDINAKWDPAATGIGVGSGRGGRFQSRPAFGGEFTPRPSGGSEGDDTDDGPTPAVDWHSADQGNIRARHFDFSDTSIDNEPPTTIEILYAMEDYWVLKALMQIVARTNTDDSGRLADAPHKAIIREIQSITIGKEVQSSVGQVFRLADDTAVEGEGLRGGTTPPPGVTPGLEGGEGGGLASAEVNELAEGRYVDQLLQPVSASTLNSAATGQNEEEAYLAVAKRMPVRMRVKMDQRNINEFLVECGNGDLMLEVVQVRVNPDAPSVQSQGGVSPGTSSIRRPVGGVGRVGGNEGTSPQGAEYPWDVEVEVYGIIYIFNPPSAARLGLSDEDKAKLDQVNLDDADAVEAAASEPSEGTPPTDETPTDETPAEDDPADADAADADAAADDGEAPAATDAAPPTGDGGAGEAAAQSDPADAAVPAG